MTNELETWPDLHEEGRSMRARPRVSVIIPAWNRREILRMSVESVLRQTFTDFELIVVDDGSTDGTMEAISDIRDPRLRRLAHETNRGVSAARNTGIRSAVGEWIAFNDSDDEWLPLKLEKQMTRLNQSGPEVVACYTGLLHIERSDRCDGRTFTRYFPDAAVRVVEGNLHMIMLSSFVPVVFTQTFITRRKELITVGGFDENMLALEDLDCFLRLAKRGPFVFIDEPLVSRNLSGNSLSHDLKKMQEGRNALIGNHLDEYLSLAPGLLIAHYINYAGMKLRFGDFSGAHEALSKAASLRPWSPSIRLRQVRLCFRELNVVFAKWRRCAS